MNIYSEAIKKAKRVYVCGNGGSASTANHFVNDLVKKCGIKAYSLSSNEALLTALANDEGYRKVFVEQVRIYVEAGDLVITISTSGKSANIEEVHKYCTGLGINCMNFPIYGLEPEPSEDMHLGLAHNICDELQRWHH
jgi:D-sedoheptulose 7-phosphate isomerase